MVPRPRTAAAFLLLLLLCLLPALAGCSRSAGPFSDQNARAHVEMLAGAIGSRPAGTPQSARAREYVIDQLKLFGYEVRVQETDARRPEYGLTARVSNVIAVLQGERREAIGLLSHYDSNPDSPGGSDDAFGVAVSLEAARLIASRPRTWSTLVIVTDAEEVGLMGAAALMTDREVSDRLQTYINIESTGSAGPAMLFETGPGNNWLVAPWARSAPHPRGGSFALEVYRRLPNDTDFSILRRHDVPGLNFATVGDSYAYHTARDTSERLSQGALRSTGENVLSIVDALQRRDITQRSTRDATYFDIGGTVGIAYSSSWDWVITIIAIVLGAAGWVRVTRFVTRESGTGPWAIGFLWAALGVAAVAAGMVGATWLLRAAREVYHPWYARPDRLFFMLLSVGAAIAWGMTRLGRWFPARARGLRHPAVVWTYTLPLWIVLAGAGSWFAPSAGYLWTLPLLSAGLLLSIIPSSNATVVRMVSVVVLAVSATLWVRDTLELLRFMVAVFGRLPIVTPAFLFAAVLTMAGLVVAPPFIAAAATDRRLTRPALLTALCLLGLGVSVPLTYAAQAYTFEQPLRRQVRALQEPDSPVSLWYVSSVEPGLDLGEGAPGTWSPGQVTSSSGVPWGTPREPFVFSTSAPPIGRPPADITALTLQDVEGGIELSIMVVPREPGLAVSFILPADAVPARSSLPGMVRGRRWTAVYAAMPMDGVPFRASFSGVAAERLRGTQVTVTSARLPGGGGWQQLPAWLPQERAVWTARVTWLLAPPAPVQASLEVQQSLR
ncbi:MAG: M28 family peptidase [Vicinamibacterales bacterium]